MPCLVCRVLLWFVFILRIKHPTISMSPAQHSWQGLGRPLQVTARSDTASMAQREGAPNRKERRAAQRAQEQAEQQRIARKVQKKQP